MSPRGSNGRFWRPSWRCFSSSTPSSRSFSRSSRSGKSAKGGSTGFARSPSAWKATCRPRRRFPMAEGRLGPFVALLRGFTGKAVLAGLALGLLPRGAGAAVGDPTRGQSLFVAKGCVQCHAVRGAGGTVGPDLGRTAVKGSFFEIAAAMWNHSGAMEEKMREFRMPRPAFEGQELSDLLGFLYFLNYFDEPGQPRVGKVL